MDDEAFIIEPKVLEEQVAGKLSSHVSNGPDIVLATALLHANPKMLPAPNQSC